MLPFTVIPAIDIRAGRCVRLRQGLATEETVYSDDPVAVAQRWSEQGAQWLHVVDLDGAFAGRPTNLDLIARIVKAAGVPVQAGGGIRTESDIRVLLDLGVRRAIVGTVACRDRATLADWARTFGGRLALGIDARQGKVQVKGWTETTGIDATELAAAASRLGIATIIYTDTARDGMLGGVNIAAVAAICRAADCHVIASGGVSSTADVLALREAALQNLAGAVVGKALYDGKVGLAEMIEAARRPLI